MCNIMSIIRDDKKYTKKGRPKGAIFEENILIRIDKETKEKIKKIAKRRNTTISELIRKELIKLAREGK